MPAGRRGIDLTEAVEHLGPPIGRHRYFHKLYALDSVLPEMEKPTKSDLEQAMKGHVLDKAELIGTYQKQ